MPLGTLQSFVQGFEGAANAGLGLRERLQAMAEAKARRAAETAAGQDLMSQLAAIPAAGAPSPAAAPQPAQPIALKPPVAAGLDPQALAGLAALNKDITANPVAPAQPAPAAKPVDPNLSATAQPDSMGAQPSTGPGMDAIRDAQQNIRAMAQSIKASNPGIDPRTLLLAVEREIDNIKGVAPLTKATMQAQVSILGQQSRLQAAQQSYQAKIQVAMLETDTKKQVALINQATNEFRAEMGLKAAEARAGATVQAAGINAGARVQSAEIAADSRENVANITGEHRDYAADQGERGAEARAGTGKPTSPAPARPSARVARPPVPGARKAPDGHWYVQKGSQFFRVD